MAFRTAVPVILPSSILGFFLILVFYSQYLSGLLLSILYLPDPSFVIVIREEINAEVHWFGTIHESHVSGVDLIFLGMYLHMLKKITLSSFSVGDWDGWVTGTTLFAVFHVVVFFGITLSATHLAEITVTIGANIFWSLFGKTHYTFALLFGNQHLSTDILVRFMLFHYAMGFYLTFFLFVHINFVHEEWDSDVDVSAYQDTQNSLSSWVHDNIESETNWTLLILLVAHHQIVRWPWYCNGGRPLDYYFFEHWSEAEVEDINYFAVSPHWYFRPHMGLLTICAKHYEGIFWLVMFYCLILAQPFIAHGFEEYAESRGWRLFPYNPVLTKFRVVLIASFVSCCVYVNSVLPCGRFYYDVSQGFSGATTLKLSYQYIYMFLAFFHHNLEPLDYLFFHLRVRIHHHVGEYIY